MNEEKTYYSNCFIEAVKAKIKYGRKVTIKWVSTFENHKNYKVFCPHFYWIDNQTRKRYSFHTDAVLHFPQWLFFKGYIKQQKARE